MANARPRSRPVRSPTEWAVRGVLALCVVGAGYGAVTFSLAQFIASRDPATAHRLAPYDGRITSEYAASLIANEASNAKRQEADALARHALRQDPSAVPAVATLGINAQSRGDVTTARKLFAYTNSLSRRNIVMQLWAIEDAVGRNDIVGALRHYDIALRTKPGLSELLFPIMAQASSDPEIRQELIRTLGRRPPWSEAFIEAAAGAADALSIAKLFYQLKQVGVTIPEASGSRLVDGLIAKGHVNAAWSYYTTLRPGADRRRSRDADFAAVLDVPSQFDWVLINDGTISSSVQHGDKSGVFDFAAPASIGGVVLKQLQVLPAGTYTLTGRSRGFDPNNPALPYWTVTCREGATLTRVALKPGEDEQPYSGSFRVPANCPVQMLTLIAQPTDAAAGLSGQIVQAQIAPEQ